MSPVLSLIHKTPNIPYSSLMLYEKLKLNQGSVIKLSDFCQIRMNSCVCHIVCWQCVCGARGLKMHIHQLFMERDLLTVGLWGLPSPEALAQCAEPPCQALSPLVPTSPYKQEGQAGQKQRRCQPMTWLCKDGQRTSLVGQIPFH